MNLYAPARVKARDSAWNPSTPFHPSYYYEKFELPGRKMNLSRGWEIYPRIMYDMAMRIKNEYGNIEWLVTENGMGVENNGNFKNEDTRRLQDRVYFRTFKMAFKSHRRRI
ncbi:family 1 glycosylhydrolase [Thermoanaerobacterium thermosaccharolyticum]|uniref:family 1 glycosylhydrolase n=1 Tax=Thermoanaerobacterium thermosaccharolyticum TaxID=1517 RepID=UPI00211AE7D1|nr:family 1 glycosylhydrolase [Thermoanaerobacterium thermosaccharolyticum]